MSVLDCHQLKMHCLNLALIPTFGKMIELQSVKFLWQHRLSEFYCTGQEIVGDMGRETFVFVILSIKNALTAGVFSCNLGSLVGNYYSQDELQCNSWQ